MWSRLSCCGAPTCVIHKPWCLYRWGNNSETSGGPLSHLTKTLVNKMRRRFSPGQNDDFNLLKEYQTQGSHPYIPGMWSVTFLWYLQVNKSMFLEQSSIQVWVSRPNWHFWFLSAHFMSGLLRFANYTQLSFLLAFYHFLWSVPDISANASLWLWQQREDILTKMSQFLKNYYVCIDLNLFI